MDLLYYHYLTDWLVTTCIWPVTSLNCLLLGCYPLGQSSQQPILVPSEDYMKGILEFDLTNPDGEEAHALALYGPTFLNFIEEFQTEVLRPLCKYGIPDHLLDPNKLLDHISERFHEIKNSCIPPNFL